MKLLFILLVLSAQAPSTPHPEAEKEIILGTALAKNIEQRDGSLNDLLIGKYLRGLAGKLAGAISRPPLEVRVTRSPEQYAILLPRHILYLSSGLLLRTETESELAAILAHEQAHPTTMHLMNASQPASIVTRGPNCVLASPVLAFGWAASLRKSEIEANALAAQNLRSAGYDPVSLYVVLSKLAYEHAGWEKALLAGDLEAGRSTAESEPLPAGGYIVDSSDFAAMHERLQHITGAFREPAKVTLLRR